jgi:hypothetical protein
LQGAWVLVTARFNVIGVEAPLERTANVIGTWIGIVTSKGLSGQAFSVIAEIIVGAYVAVVARRGIVLVDTTLVWLAGISGAHIAIVAIQW